MKINLKTWSDWKYKSFVVFG